jgi:hypothetical protein
MTKRFRHEGDYPRSAAAEILEFVDTSYENSRLGQEYAGDGREFAGRKMI